jgi:SAM-dependent methyltransferase
LPSAKPPLLWLRFPHEASGCPACGSARIELLDAFKIARDAQRRRVAFLTGCHDCGLLFANPLPTPEQLQQHYAVNGAWAATRKTRGMGPPKPAAARDPRDVLLEALAPYAPICSPPRAAKVLDFGCGDGKFLDRLQRSGWETYGIEPSTTAAFARHHRLDVPPQDATFDLVILHHVLEHVTTPLDILRQLAATLREGGVMFIGVPRLDTLPQHRDFKYCIDGRHHLICLSDTCLRGLLARVGMTIIARLDSPALDEALTAGQPRRLRLVAVRTMNRLALPETPLRQADEALALYARSRGAFESAMRAALPVRVRGAWLDRAIEHRARRRKKARAQV